MAIRYAVNCSILFTELPLLQRPAAAAAAGFDAVEFWWSFASAAPTDGEVDAFVAAVEDAGVCLTGLNFAAGDMPAGDRGLVSWPGRASEFRDAVAVAVGIGARLGTRAFNALYGNRIDGVTGQDDVADANLAFAAEEARKIGATVVLEPLSGGRVAGTTPASAGTTVAPTMLGPAMAPTATRCAPRPTRSPCWTASRASRCSPTSTTSPSTATTSTP